MPPIPDACRCHTAGPGAGARQDRAASASLAHLYLCEGLSTYRIAQVTGLDRQRVARVLRRAGVPLRPRGAGAARPERRRGDPANLPGILADLYVSQRLTTLQIAAVLGIPDRTVRDRLRRYGIKTRSKGDREREHRRILPADALQDLYSRDGLSADDVGQKLGASRTVVLRNAHELGLAVRTGGAVPQSGAEEIQLISALHADPFVDATLAEYQILPVPAGGQIWQRFPVPVPLSRQLVEDLYWRCGVGIHHIELLTGQPAQTVADFMRRAGIAIRHPGGRSPFLRRWRAGSAGDWHNCSGILLDLPGAATDGADRIDPEKFDGQIATSKPAIPAANAE